MATNNVENRQSETWNEILSQSSVWLATLQELKESATVEQILKTSANVRSWLFVGCGTSFYLAEAAAATWTLLSGERARAVPASEILLYPSLSQTESAPVQAVVISRSGRTSEAVRAANTLKHTLKVPTLGLTCAKRSALEAECDATLVLRAADEKSTVMTRSFTSMLITLQYLAARRGGNDAFIQSLAQMAQQFAERIPSLAEKIESFVSSHTFEDYVFLGQGPFHAIAREAALKVMEMSCSYSQFFHALEFRHGPKSIVTERTCLTFFLSATAKQLESEVLQEMKELGGVTIAVCNHATENILRSSDLIVEMKIAVNELALLAPFTVPAQLLGFFTGLGKGLNPDEPKNLTRVVILD
jgi:glucosamine--fructose-6-phosphate aminotransferase (isomerizing)